MLHLSNQNLNLPFIADQRIWYLDAPSQNAKKECLKPEIFALARQVRKETPDGFERHGMPAGCRWVEVPNRAEFLANTSNRRLCLTIDAGIGKTIAVLQTQFLRSQSPQGHLVIGFNFDDLPKDANEYLRGDILLKQLCIELPDCDEETARALLKRKIRTQQFTLIVDALDQTSEGGAKKKATALAQFLNRICPGCCCVVAGRPPAIERFWRQLFANSDLWLFAQIDQFTDRQRKEFLGPERHKKLNSLDADLVAVPRMLETVHRVHPDDLDEIQTAADLYWRAVQTTLEESMVDQDVSINFEDALFYYSLLAFELIRQGYFDGIKDTKETRTFVKDVLKRRLASEIREHEGDEEFTQAKVKKRIKDLTRLITFTEHAFHDSRGIWKRIVYRDRTLLDFFGAVWVTRYSGNHLEDSDEPNPDVEWLGNHQFVRSNRDTAQYKQFWRFATEMPMDAIDERIYAESMAVLFESRPYPNPYAEHSVIEGVKYRSTEMIYRSMPPMLRLAGFEVPDNFNDKSMRAPIEQVQNVAWSLVASIESSGNLVEAVNDRAAGCSVQKALLTYFCDYPATLKLGMNGPIAQKVAAEFEKWFVPVPQQEGASLWFSGQLYDGDGDVFHAKIDASFLLGKYQTTNELYWLFDYCDKDDSNRMKPVADIDWFDSWAAALYFHCRLPTEDEWEYANRGRPGKVDDSVKPFQCCFEDDEEKLAEYANYDEGNGYELEEVGRRKGHCGLHDMHGNVWEWSLNYWVGDSVKARNESREFEAVTGSRVLRGGSFISVADNCRSSFRDLWHPGSAYHLSGVRFSRARKS